MAAVEVVMPAPALPPPVPGVRIGRLALAAADTFVCLWIASLWAIHASLAVLATAVICRLVICGLKCTGAAWMILFYFSPILVGILSPLAAMLPIKVVELYTNQPNKGAAIFEAIFLELINATMVFFSLEVFGVLLNLFAAEDSPAERIASVIMVVPLLGISVMCCLVSIPRLAVRVWRMRRCTNFASVVPI